jgi:hypothetical protein
MGQNCKVSLRKRNKMAEEHEPVATQPDPDQIVVRIRNLGEPIRFSNVENLCGFVAEPALSGQTVKVFTRLGITSDHPSFHRLAEGFESVVASMTQRSGKLVSLNRADTILLVIKANNTAELWLDTAAVAIQCVIKRDTKVGMALFDSDIADINGMSFPAIEFEPTDRILCLFRESWSFAFAFDFNPEGNLDIESFSTTLGTLYRELRYRHLYSALADEALFGRLVSAGWFPFVEIITNEFKELLSHCQSGFDVTEIEDTIVSKFDEERMQRIFERWMAKPHYAAKKTILKAGIDAYNRRDPISAIKIVLTEIEGVMRDAYRAAHGGQGAKLKDVLKFAVESAKRKAGHPNTLWVPDAFAKYLKEHTFAGFDPVHQTGTAGSRNPVGHGAAVAESYTMTRALQAILTLDQLAFYT